jgi:hypothetical protein
MRLQRTRREDQERLQTEQLEYQTRTALRESYAQLLTAQRRSREASISLAKAGGTARDEKFANAAVIAHTEFIDAYHMINLDASADMWREARGLRNVVDKMLEHGKDGNAAACEAFSRLHGKRARTWSAASAYG